MMLTILVAVIIAVGAVFVVRNNRKNAEALLVSMKKKADLNKDGVVNAKDAAVVVDAVKTTVATAKKKYGGKVKKTKSL
jgi:hypothetical protein